MSKKDPAPKKRIFAPVFIPWERRMQTAMIAAWVGTLPVSLFSICVVLAGMAMMWSFEFTMALSVSIGFVGLYCIHILTDRRWRRNGARSLRLTRSAAFQRVSKWFTGYFPHSVHIDGVKDQNDFDSMMKVFPNDKNYMFACHPHGVFGLGVWSTFVANVPGNTFFHNACFGEKPLFHTTIHTLSMNFWIPFWRELLLYLGFVDVDKKTLVHGLTRKKEQKVGRICMLIPGGAAESIDCATPTLTLKNRKGFIKLAVETGASLVPVFTFGENYLYKPVAQPKGIIRKVLFTLQKTMGIGMPMVCGRGIFNYRVGPLPHREEMITVIGTPISVPHKPKGSHTAEDIDEVHARYIEAVSALYEKYQPVYDPHSEYKELILR